MVLLPWLFSHSVTAKSLITKTVNTLLLVLPQSSHLSLLKWHLCVSQGELINWNGWDPITSWYTGVLVIVDGERNCRASKITCKHSLFIWIFCFLFVCTTDCFIESLNENHLLHRPIFSDALTESKNDLEKLSEEGICTKLKKASVWDLILLKPIKVSSSRNRDLWNKS